MSNVKIRPPMILTRTSAVPASHVVQELCPGRLLFCETDDGTTAVPANGIGTSSSCANVLALKLTPAIVGGLSLPLRKSVNLRAKKGCDDITACVLILIKLYHESIPKAA
jgi:hypothetical protein